MPIPAVHLLLGHKWGLSHFYPAIAVAVHLYELENSGTIRLFESPPDVCRTVNQNPSSYPIGILKTDQISWKISYSSMSDVSCTFLFAIRNCRSTLRRGIGMTPSRWRHMISLYHIRTHVRSSWWLVDAVHVYAKSLKEIDVSVVFYGHNINGMRS